MSEGYGGRGGSRDGEGWMLVEVGWSGGGRGRREVGGRAKSEATGLQLVNVIIIAV